MHSLFVNTLSYDILDIPLKSWLIIRQMQAWYCTVIPAPVVPSLLLRRTNDFPSNNSSFVFQTVCVIGALLATVSCKMSRAVRPTRLVPFLVLVCFPLSCWSDDNQLGGFHQHPLLQTSLLLLWGVYSSLPQLSPNLLLGRWSWCIKLVFLGLTEVAGTQQFLFFLLSDVGLAHCVLIRTQ